ncbi:MAG: bifunctional diaminohydroxyphosphoribosylaminopyrimidine deaminase/5-amino-6-(5-phosphoribosylamino)uracil reductase RibD [Lentisphaeria bacterium]|nr:bifunctional diaminohydroxyphosphoribosylaminopyrimidine deaminase/5-amino-6-(5-phosphoribosylamino)uracil reductase RibD [Lentisphaeria bacterium]
MERHSFFMTRALRQALRAWGKTSPNPMVGAVVVNGDDQIIGEGYHPKAGLPHAEVYALRSAGQMSKGQRIYITLEPCSSYGRTPPCVEAIIKAGISEVYIGAMDPDARHRGRAVKILQDAGIEVFTGILEEPCTRLNEAFFHWVQFKTPFVCLKMAMTLDGKIATASGISKWVTGSHARAKVQQMRRWSDAILVGGETYRIDDPNLTVRGKKTWEKQPAKLVWSQQLSNGRKLRELNENTFNFFSANDIDDWQNALQYLGEQHICSLLVEGGGFLAAKLLELGLVHKIYFFMAPKILGGNENRDVVSGQGFQSLQEACEIDQMTCTKLGKDFLFTGYPNNVYRFS